MKRDLDLIRRILIEIEENLGFNQTVQIAFDDVNTNDITYNLKLLYDAGFIEGFYQATSDNGYFAVNGMTWQGHEFIDAARNETIWNEAKSISRSKGIDLGIDIMKGLLTSIITRHIGI